MNNKVKAEYMEGLKLSGFPLTSKYLPGIFKTARELSVRYQVGQDYEDFVQLAIIEATRLEPIFDDSKGSTFMSFVRKPIKQVAQKFYGYSRSSTNKFNKVSKYMEAYLVENKVYPTVPEIAKALNMTEFLVKSIYFGKPFKVSLESLGDDFTIENDEQTKSSELIDDLISGLPVINQKIITGYFLEELSLEELASVHKVSKGAVKVLIDESLVEIREKHK